MEDAISVSAMLTATVGFAVFLLGAGITRQVRLLREFNIPEPVTGGLIAAICFTIFTAISARAIDFDMQSRDYFLVLFFSAIGLNARFGDLIRGGRILALLLLLTFVAIVVQNIIGVASAKLFGMPFQTSALFGSAALIGGHGTAIAWSPKIAEAANFEGAPELGIAMATLGLISASLVGGPIARYLVTRNNLTSSETHDTAIVGVSFEDENKQSDITHVTLMRVTLVLHVTIIGGVFLQRGLADLGLMLPLFVPCLMVGIAVGNAYDRFLPNSPAVSRSTTLAEISDFALGTFLAISLMTINLATLSELGFAILGTITLQTVLTVILVILLLFPVLGRNYDAAVLASGFAGFSLGATPTAIANMTAVTKRYGPAPLAFVVLPLVSAFFVDIANAVVIQMIVDF
ncbi:ESS family glutamate:Na+ symporter [Shimia isoporae]|uniref:Sodium/glutamate symporter n=1 Tax=Shimia isoporae TaxID=647720 RepID=A0A4R1NKL3_9RHOB|nr:sodium/glutamate symporter [Shimia isoporae]TCL08625.1 ESS family glutamate:Na+ symporter [Shimia isoporae]